MLTSIGCLIIIQEISFSILLQQAALSVFGIDLYFTQDVLEVLITMIALLGPQQVCIFPHLNDLLIRNMLFKKKYIKDP